MPRLHQHGLRTNADSMWPHFLQRVYRASSGMPSLPGPNFLHRHSTIAVSEQTYDATDAYSQGLLSQRETEAQPILAQLLPQQRKVMRRGRGRVAREAATRLRLYVGRYIHGLVGEAHP